MIDDLRDPALDGESFSLAMDREWLGRAQSQLLAALVARAATPPRFDQARLRIQAEALIAKRCDVVAGIRPDLVDALGAQFRALFTSYARANPRPTTGARADAEAFARTHA